MRELTASLPKPMVEVGKPILRHIVDGLRDSGIGEICLIVGYRQVARDYFEDGSALGLGNNLINTVLNITSIF